MANEEQLEMLKSGVQEWNAWRAKTSYTTRVDLHAANLSGADLSGANLTRADLTVADLTGGNLAGTNLTDAILYWADLTEANLTDAFLRRVNFSGARLRGANLTEAHLDHAVLGDVDLRDVLGLDSCEYLSPCILDHSTLMKSGAIPLVFLRGCGLPDSLIDYLPSLLNAGPIQFCSCFISYSSKDQDFADRLYADLQNRGVRCWFAPHDIQAGKKVHEQIDEAIRLYDRLLLILSDHSMNSEWVKTEIAHARQKELNEERRVLFPVGVVPFETIRNWKNFDADTGKDSAREIREYFMPDFSHWKDHDSYAESFERLLRDLKATKPANP